MHKDGMYCHLRRNGLRSQYNTHREYLLESYEDKPRSNEKASKKKIQEMLERMKQDQIRKKSHIANLSRPKDYDSYLLILAHVSYVKEEQKIHEVLDQNVSKGKLSKKAIDKLQGNQNTHYDSKLL